MISRFIFQLYTNSIYFYSGYCPTILWMKRTVTYTYENHEFINNYLKKKKWKFHLWISYSGKWISMNRVIFQGPFDGSINIYAIRYRTRNFIFREKSLPCVRLLSMFIFFIYIKKRFKLPWRVIRTLQYYFIVYTLNSTHLHYNLIWMRSMTVLNWFYLRILNDVIFNVRC